MATSSLQLIDRIKRGDREAFAPLFDKYRPRLAVLIHFRMGPQLRPLYEVDDLLQETMLRAYRDVDRFDYRKPGSFFLFLARIAEHVVIDAARSQHCGKRNPGLRVPLRSDSHPSGIEPVDANTPSKLFREQESLGRLIRHLDALPGHYRQVIILAKIDGLTTQQIADRLGKSREAASLILHRALKQLREMQEQGGSR
jgi:RNA polymerase sigma-70 factor (ECF subfamily)